MVMISRIAIAAALMWAPPAFSQVAQDQDHSAHHPDAGASAQQQQSVAPGASGMGRGMMGGDVGGSMSGRGQTGPGSMMSMMNMMMGAPPGADHIEGRLAFIKAELKITEAQEPKWNVLADTVRGNVGAMAEMHTTMGSGQGSPSTLPERLSREDRLVAAHLAALKKTEDAVAQLYSVLADEQKKLADTIVIGPMGMLMGMM